MIMTKGQMREVLTKVDTLEKLLMRELDDSELNYLLDHSVEEFLYDVLGFEKEELLVLKKIKKIISDWCTKPTTDVNTVNEDINLFFDTPEFEEEKSDNEQSNENEEILN